MSEDRLKPRFTAAEGARLQAVAVQLGLRPAQVAERLLLRTLSPVPLVNRGLWAELAPTAHHLGQLRRHLELLEAPPHELVRMADELEAQLRAYRCSLLGLSLESTVPEQPVPSRDLQEEP